MRALSLFSGAGGLDLGFERAGFEHVASVDSNPTCVSTLRRNRPDWSVLHADVRETAFSEGSADVVHGGPPCQPFSMGGRGAGEMDDRNMWPAFSQVISDVRPSAFVGENVRGMLRRRFRPYVEAQVVAPLEAMGYVCRWYGVNAIDVDVPQTRCRVFLVGLRSDAAHVTFADALEKGKCGLRAGARAALGLSEDGYADGPCPTVKCSFSSPRLTTSIDSGPGSMRKWRTLGIWPCGVQDTRAAASAMPVTADASLHRLCVDDVRRLQGFPVDWELVGCRSKQLGLLGNSVPPPMAECVARAIRIALQTS